MNHVATATTLDVRLGELEQRLAAETPAELAGWVIINPSTCQALAIELDGKGTVIEATQVPLWHATRFPRVQSASTKTIREHVGGKSVRVRDMYAYWKRKLRCRLDGLKGLQQAT